MKLTLDSGHGGRVKFDCLQCGSTFYVYPCRVRRGNVKFCSTGCGTKYRNLHDNPSSRPEVRAKISANHADVSGERNPMYGRRGELAPAYVDGRNEVEGSSVWQRVAFRYFSRRCSICGSVPSNPRRLHVHHKDRNRSNNEPSNLEVVCVDCHNNVRHPMERDSLGRFVRGVA